MDVGPDVPFDGDVQSPAARIAEGDSRLAEKRLEVADIDLLHLDPTDDAEKLAELRIKRSPGSFGDSRETTYLNVKVVDLLIDETTDDALLLSLMRLDDREVPRLGATLLTHYNPSPDQLDRFNDRLNRLYEKKIAVFEARMREHGVEPSVPEDKQLLDTIRDLAANPESAVDVPKDFWDMHRTLSAETAAAFLLFRGPLPQAAAAINTIKAHGLEEHVSQMMYHMPGLSVSEQDSYATSLRQAIDMMDVKDRSAIQALCEYDNPAQAVRLAQAMGMEAKQYGDLRRVFIKLFEKEPIIRVSADTINTLIAALPSVPNDSLTLAHLSFVYGTFSDRDDRQTRALELKAALSEFPEGMPEDLLGAVLTHVHPHEAALAIKAHRQQWDALSPHLRDSIKGPISPTEDMGALIEAATRVEALCKEYDLPITPRNNGFFMSPAMRSGVNLKEQIRDIAGRSFAWDAIELHTRLEHEALMADQPARPFALDLYPECQQFFAQLGLPAEMAEHMTTAWYRYSLYKVAVEAAIKWRGLKEGDMFDLKDLTQAELQAGFRKKVGEFTNRLLELTRYIDAYGIEETVEVYRTFGTVNFARMTPEQQHNQLERWRSGEVPKTLALVTDREYDTAFKKVSGEIVANFGEEGTFVFEAAGRRDIARRIRQVGDRDRAHGRDPLLAPTVETVILAGHGDTEGVDIGDDRIATEDYVRAKRAEQLYRDPGHVAPNGYRRDLGNRYQLIFDACLVGAPVKDGKNITEYMSERHGVRAQGAAEEIFGIATIDAEGNATYHVESGEAGAASYGVRR